MIKRLHRLPGVDRIPAACAEGVLAAGTTDRSE